MHIYRYTSRTVSQVLEDDKGRKAGAEWLIVKFRGMAARTQSLRWAGGRGSWLALVGTPGGVMMAELQVGTNCGSRNNLRLSS